MDLVGRKDRTARRRCEHLSYERSRVTRAVVERDVELAVVLGGPLGVVDDARQSTDGRLRRRIRRHGSATGGAAEQVGHAEQHGHALAAEERRDDRLVGLLPDRCEHVGDLLAAGVERRDVDRDERIGVGARDRLLDRRLEVVGVGVGTERDRLGDLQPGGRRGVGDDAAPTASELPTIDDAVAPRQRLVGQQLGDVEHLVQRVDLDDAGLAEHRVDRGLRGGVRLTVWPTGTPCVERPDLTATIGLVRETRRAMRENLRGLPIDSR